MVDPIAEVRESDPALWDEYLRAHYDAVCAANAFWWVSDYGDGFAVMRITLDDDAPDDWCGDVMPKPGEDAPRYDDYEAALRDALGRNRALVAEADAKNP